MQCFTVTITTRCVRRAQLKKLHGQGRSLLLTVYVCVRTLCAPDPSVSRIRVCGYDAWKHNFCDASRFIEMLYLSHLWGQAGGEERVRSFSRSIAEFIPRRGLESASLHSRGEGSHLQSHDSCVYLVLKEELTLDVTTVVTMKLNYLNIFKYKYNISKYIWLIQVHPVKNLICNFVHTPGMSF